ncbi:uncharacterized protein LOC103836824 [Brassica rapa]|uniref:uncharacterized protein LOC103836824 n=1 Tax=Brassica campestris TaxID=3711 RepID=UPI00142E4EA4|nr:uncharacterized protein LOC103836824 [Brassica rapa]
MKWELKGEILAAVGRDANNRIYPIAWAIVRVEDNASWAWFVDKLKSDLDLGLGNGFTIISDKQKGLINAVADLLPAAEHRHCARHIFANWKKVYGASEYEDYFWAIAYSFTKGDYQFNLHALEVFDAKAHEDLLKTEPKTWCRAFFSTHARCEDVCNNLSESYNRTIREARKLPLINMLEEIRRLAMKRNSRRRDKTSGCSTPFPPNIMEIFEQNRKASDHCTVIKSSESLYEVSEFDCSYEVCLPYKHCACNRWDITGIPCQHAIYVINEHNKEPEDYVDPYYLTTRWQETYENNIKPVNGERLWEKTFKDPIQIPDKRKMPGRPKNYDRIKEAHESKTNPTKATREGRRMTCSNCKQTGHNCGTCTRQAVPDVPKGKRGRPKKTPTPVSNK